MRDHRVRWALEEAGLPYDTRLIDQQTQDAPDYRYRQPFGQAPYFEEGSLVMFESGAILLHIAERSEVLLPKAEDQRARAITWLLAALNSIEIHVQQLAQIDLFYPDEEWAKLRRPSVEKSVRKRLTDLAAWLEDREYLEDRFTVGDLMMTTVLRNLRQTDILASFPTLHAYKTRCEARPAFKKALHDQLAVFEKHAPPGKAA